jgi:antagonist of KipI
MIEVVKAPPFATVQDLGWRTGRAWGLPLGGAMDPALMAAANDAVGNDLGAAALEWALGPGVLRFEQRALVCVLRGAELRVEGETMEGAIVPVPAGGVLEVIPGGTERFLYVAVRGGFAVAPKLGSRSTYTLGEFGGYEGRRLRTGDRLPMGEAGRHTDRGTARSLNAEGAGRLRRGGGAAPMPAGPKSAGEVVLRVTRGPQWDRFGAAARETFFSSPFTVSNASNRFGYRLTGPTLAPREAATLPSEAACPGAVQIPDAGEPIVLMPDGPTVGGYPKIAVVIRVDLRLLAQCPPRRKVRFREVSLEEARETLHPPAHAPTVLRSSPRY